MNRDVLKYLAAGLCLVLLSGHALAASRNETRTPRKGKFAAAKVAPKKARSEHASGAHTAAKPAKRGASKSASAAAARLADTQSSAWSAEVARSADAARWVAGGPARRAPLVEGPPRGGAVALSMDASSAQPAAVPVIAATTAAMLPPRASAPRVPARRVKGFHAPDAYFVLQKEVAAALLERDLEKAEGACRAQILLRPDRSLPYYNLATVHSLRGHQDRAIESLTRAQERGFGFPDLLLADPDLSRLHAHALWPQIVERAKSLESSAMAERASEAMALAQQGTAVAPASAVAARVTTP